MQASYYNVVYSVMRVAPCCLARRCCPSFFLRDHWIHFRPLLLLFFPRSFFLWTTQLSIDLFLSFFLYHFVLGPLVIFSWSVFLRRWFFALFGFWLIGATTWVHPCRELVWSWPWLVRPWQSRFPHSPSLIPKVHLAWVWGKLYKHWDLGGWNWPAD